MKKLIVFLLVLFSFLSLGIIIVDERQNAVVTNVFSHKQQVLPKGLHFILPGIERVSYVFMNQREAAVTVMLNFNDTATVEAGILVVWHVTNPAKYLNYFIKDEFNKQLTEEVLRITASRVQSTNLSTFNQLHNLLVSPLYIEKLGIVITEILPNELSLISRPKTVAGSISSNAEDAENVTKNESSQNMPVVESTIDNSGYALRNGSNDGDDLFIIESAYYQAQMIKVQTEIEQAKMLAPLQEKDQHFYNYYRELQIYKDSAKSKQDMPPLDKLYH